ncbi:hypothetical protein AWZ03_015049, partial [Drosophila navojoa]
MTATIDTGATRSFISEDCVRQRTTRGERCHVESRIRLADGSALDVTKMMKTNVSLAGKTAEVNLLIMATMLDHVILGMDFLCAIGTTVRCGNAELEMWRDAKESGPKRLREASTRKEDPSSAIAVSTVGVESASSQGTPPNEKG